MASPVKKTALRMVLVGIAMFGFAIFVMPPLYDVFCEITGIGGKTATGPSQQTEVEVDKSRTVKVQFIATNNADMPWEFEPMIHEVKVYPGEKTRIAYYARNTTERDMVAQAVPSVSPGTASQFLNKVECFCFNEQPLKAGEEAEMPLVFYIDPELPRAMHTLTLSYTLFDINKDEKPAG